MKRWVQKLRETPVAHAGWEMAVMRVLFAWLVWRMLPESVPYTTQPAPNGLGHCIDFTFLADAAIYDPLRWVACGALVLYAAGVLPVISLGYAAGLITAVGTLENSQGAIGHHLQLVCLVAWAQWIAYAGSMWRDGRGEAGRGWLVSTPTQQQAIHAAKLIIAAAYVASACVKLIASGGLWVWQLPDIALQLIKTHANVYYDTLWPQPVWSSETLPQLIVAHPNLTRLFFLPGLLFELLAFLALCGRRAALVVGTGLLVMHLLIRVVMQLSFSAHEGLLLIFFLNLPFLALGVLRRLRFRRDK